MIDLEYLKISVQEANMSLANLQDVFTGMNKADDELYNFTEKQLLHIEETRDILLNKLIELEKL